MASFGGVSFTVDRDGFQESREGRATVIEIPGGDNFYVDLAGRGPQKLSVDLLLPDATAWSTLTTLLGQQQTLSIETLDTHLAVLLTVTRPVPQLDGTTKATATFVITDA